MQMGDLSFAIEPDSEEEIAAKSLDERRAFAREQRRRRGENRPGLKPVQKLPDNPGALCDLLDADPSPGIDIARAAHWHLEFDAVVGGIGELPARVEGPA